ncbi:MAG TPA: HlyD family efflux transporter periplasmic adaptor subunit [Cystobacter sp.]
MDESRSERDVPATPSPAPKPPPLENIYRQQAIQEHANTRVDSELLRLSPEWSRWTYWVLLMVVTVGLLFCVLGTVNEYATGPAVVRVEGKSEVTMDVAGLVTSVEVEPGQRVAAGQVLVRLQAQEERTALERIEREFELQLARVLRDPGDQAARQVLTTLRAEREQAQARQEARTIRAARAGVVNDLRVRPAQYVQPGESVASLLDEDAHASLVALLPGSSRPFLRPGKSLRVELEGFQYEYRELVIDYVSDQIVGPAETRRYLGREIADALRLEGPQVLVRARLPASTFRRDGPLFNYVDGMTARAEARLHAESILVMLVPGLKVLWSDDTD